MDLRGIRKNITFSFFFIVVPVLLSGIIYLFLRSSNTVIYLVFQDLLPPGILEQMRLIFQNSFSELPKWIIYSLPGGLWLFSFTNFSLLLLNEKTKYFFKHIVLALFGIVTILEILQMIHFTDGRFDLADLALYLIASAISSLMVNFRVKRSNHQPILKNDKSPIYALGLMIGLFCATLYLADVVIN